MPPYRSYPIKFGGVDEDTPTSPPLVTPNTEVVWRALKPVPLVCRSEGFSPSCPRVLYNAVQILVTPESPTFSGSRGEGGGGEVSGWQWQPKQSFEGQSQPSSQLAPSEGKGIHRLHFWSSGSSTRPHDVDEQGKDHTKPTMVATARPKASPVFRFPKHPRRHSKA